MKTEPPADARCRDKFLVQSVTITSDKEFTNVAQIVGSSLPSLFACANLGVKVGLGGKVRHPGKKDPCNLAARFW